MIEDVVSKPAVTAKLPQASAAVRGHAGAAFKVENAKATEPSPTPISPRLRYDAVSGVVVTEFLDHAGGVQAQSPTNAVLAYLRAGLGTDGRVSKKTEDNTEKTDLQDLASEKPETPTQAVI